MAGQAAPSEKKGGPVVTEFRTLFMERFGAMVALARLLGSDDPEDTAQEAFVRLHTKWATLHDAAAAQGYLRRTVVNLSHNRTRHLKVVRDNTHREVPTLPEHHTSAETDAITADSAATLLAAIETLGPKRLAAIVLRYYLDMPFGEIAEALGCRPSTARSHVRRALDQLATILGDAHSDDAAACDEGDTA